MPGSQSGCIAFVVQILISFSFGFGALIAHVIVSASRRLYTTLPDTLSLELSTLSEQELSELAHTPITHNVNWSGIVKDFDGVYMVLVPVGCFDMGDDTNPYPNERPETRVCFKEPFWMDLTEVTQGQFASLDGEADEPSFFDGINLPVESINWFEASDFCINKRGGRLPTEAEWEYAARGPDSWMYPWGNEFDGTKIVFDETSLQRTDLVGSRPDGASWVGAVDMIGNFSEWTSTISARYPYPTDEDGYVLDDVRKDLTDKKSLLSVRGNSWNGGDIIFLRAAYRDRGLPQNRINNRGFRCVRVFDKTDAN